MKYLNVKRNLKSSFILAVILCCSFYAKSQTATKQTDASTASSKQPVAAKGAMSLVDSFFKKYKEDGTDAAIDYLFGTNKYFTNTAGITTLKSKLDSLRQSLGKYLGKDLIAQKNASNSLVFYSFLVKNEIQPIRFTFIFYKPQNEWVLYRFKYDDQLDAELEDAGKISNKRP